MEIIELIQKYVDGENIYIPRKENQRKEWGSGTFIRQELKDRNHQIFTDYKKGHKVQDLAIKYFHQKRAYNVLYET